MLVDDVAQLPVGGVGLEEVLHRSNGLGVVWLGGRHELLELVFEQFVLGLEVGIRPKIFSRISRRVSRRSTPAALRSLSRLKNSAGLSNRLRGDVINGLVPLLVVNLRLQRGIGLDGVLESLEEHAVDLHALRADGFFGDMGDGVGAAMDVCAGRAEVRAAAFAPPLPGRGSFNTSS